VPLAVVDGNVARVLARIFRVDKEFRSTEGRREFVRLADALLAPRRAGDFNQAMMELGATVCLPQQPRCAECPVRRFCSAQEREEVHRFPVARRLRKSTIRHLVAAVIRDKAGRFLTIRRPKSARRMPGFWELPMWEKNGSAGAWEANRIPKEACELCGLLGRVRHTITTNLLDISVHAATLKNGARLPGARWLAPREMDQLAVTTVTRKAVRLVNGDS
jgi:A/G-specific adenine glycosylase